MTSSFAHTPQGSIPFTQHSNNSVSNGFGTIRNSPNGPNIIPFLTEYVNSVVKAAATAILPDGTYLHDYLSWNGSIWTGSSSTAINIGQDTGQTSQGSFAVAIGNEAGKTNQGPSAVAIGNQSAVTNQGSNSVAIGIGTAKNTQGSSSIAIGNNSGHSNQGANSVAIGDEAGENNQGANSIAIGTTAGQTSQAAGSIVLNAGSVVLDNIVPNTMVVKPIRNNNGGTGLNTEYPVVYNPISGELTYAGP